MKRPLMFCAASLLSIGLISACGQGTNDEEVSPPEENGSSDEAEETNEPEEEEEDEIEIDEPEEDADEPDSSDSTDETDAGEEDTEMDETDENNSENEESTEGEDADLTEEIQFLYFDDQGMDMYRETRTVTADSEEELPVAALEEWVAGPESDELTALATDDIEVQSVEDEDGVAHVSFSQEFTDINVGSGAEMGLMDQVAHIMAQFGYGSTMILIDGETQSELFGHIDSSEPHVPEQDLSSYEEINN